MNPHNSYITDSIISNSKKMASDKVFGKPIFETDWACDWYVSIPGNNMRAWKCIEDHMKRNGLSDKEFLAIPIKNENAIRYTIYLKPVIKMTDSEVENFAKKVFIKGVYYEDKNKIK